MTDVTLLQKENKMSRILKDERGMTLVELLATVVILAIIAAIGVVAIGKVIQNSREDAGIANVQQAMNAGKLYYSTEAVSDSSDKTFTLDDVQKGGYLETAAGTWSDPENVKFTVQTDGSLTLEVPANQLVAGAKGNKALPDGTTNDDILGLTREQLWETGLSGSGS